MIAIKRGQTKTVRSAEAAWWAIRSGWCGKEPVKCVGMQHIEEALAIEFAIDSIQNSPKFWLKTSLIFPFKWANISQNNFRTDKIKFIFTFESPKASSLSAHQPSHHNLISKRKEFEGEKSCLVCYQTERKSFEGKIPFVFLHAVRSLLSMKELALQKDGLELNRRLSGILLVHE